VRGAIVAGLCCAFAVAAVGPAGAAAAHAKSAGLAASGCAVGDNGSYVPGRAGAHAFVAMSEAWNGKAWQVEPVPAPAHTTLSYLQAVSCGAANSCVAVGSGVKSPTNEDTLAAVWNGRAWQLQATPNPSSTGSNQLDGVSCRGAGHCEAVGWYDSPSGPATLAEGEGVPSPDSSCAQQSGR
jgi:hypothetical protein